MLYACLIYGDESEMANATEEQINAVMGAYYKFTQDVGDADVMRAGEAYILRPWPPASEYGTARPRSPTARLRRPRSS